jgi:hypothetical protein
VTTSRGAGEGTSGGNTAGWDVPSIELRSAGSWVHGLSGARDCWERCRDVHVVALRGVGVWGALLAMYAVAAAKVSVGDGLSESCIRRCIEGRPGGAALGSVGDCG